MSIFRFRFRFICSELVNVVHFRKKIFICLSSVQPMSLHIVDMTWDAPKINKRICSFLWG